MKRLLHVSLQEPVSPSTEFMLFLCFVFITGTVVLCSKSSSVISLTFSTLGDVKLVSRQDSDSPCSKSICFTISLHSGRLLDGGYSDAPSTKLFSSPSRIAAFFASTQFLVVCAAKLAVEGAVHDLHLSLTENKLNRIRNQAVTLICAFVAEMRRSTKE